MIPHASYEVLGEDLLEPVDVLLRRHELRVPVQGLQRRDPERVRSSDLPLLASAAGSS